MKPFRILSPLVFSQDLAVPGHALPPKVRIPVDIIFGGMENEWVDSVADRQRRLC